jgi:hypothetical protein
VAPVPQLAPDPVSPSLATGSETVSTSGARDCSLGSGVVECLIKNKDPRSRLGQPCGELFDIRTRFFVILPNASLRDCSMCDEERRLSASTVLQPATRSRSLQFSDGHVSNGRSE